MIRTDKEIEALANTGTPSQIIDAMTAYEDYIREQEIKISELQRRLLNSGCNIDLRELEDNAETH